MRFFLLAAFACLSVVLTAASPAFTIVPTVVVYPLASSASIDRETGARIVETLANQLAQGGAIKVLPPTIGVDRQNYLADARKLGASYYVTGLATPLGNGASVVEQVVSTTSGTLVYSVTNYITSFAEIAAQGDALRQAILERSTRGIQAFLAPPPSNNTPQPSASNGPDVSVNKLFGHKKAPAAAAVALAPPANATLAILTVGGSSDFAQRAAMAQTLAGAFDRAGRHAVVVDAGTPSNAVCTANNASALVAAWLDTPPPGNANAVSALRMIAYDCNGNVAFDRTFKQPLASLSDTAVTAYLKPPKRRA